MTRIRELAAADIPRVAEIHRQAFEVAPAMTPELLDEYTRWLNVVFLEAPTRAPGRQASLVCEDGNDVIGFFGVVPRTVALNGRQYEATAGSNLVVLPERRGGVGSKIIAEYLARSGDFAIVDEPAERAARLFGRAGMIVMPQTVRWTLPLSPLRHVISTVGGYVPGTGLVGPFAGLLDRVARRVRRSPFHYDPSELLGEPLSGDGLARLLAEFGSPQDLRPVTSDGSTEWLLRRARGMRQHGELQLVALRHGDGPVVGWYVYYAKRGGPGEVLQLVAASEWTTAALEHLAGHALARGVISLTGVMDSRFLPALSLHWAVLAPFPRQTNHVMVHSKHPEILEAFWRNRVLLSRLDGEWPQHMR